MPGLRRSLPVFQPPPCMCDEIEGRVRAAIAMRDEMAKWPTPLEAWIDLQQMPVLTVKPAPTVKPKPSDDWDTWTTFYQESLKGRMSEWKAQQTPLTTSVHRLVQAPPPQTENPYRLGTLYDSAPMVVRLLPGESFEVGTILERGTQRFQIVQRLYDNTNCVKVRRI